MTRDDDRRHDLYVSHDGRVTLEGRAAAGRLREHTGGFRFVPSPTDLLVLRRTEKSSPWMAGELTDRATLVDLLQFVSGAGWTGEFTLVSDVGRRTLSFDRCAVIAARSTVPAERLGEVIYRRGRVSREALDSIVGALGPERRIGEALVDLGELRQGDVFAMLQAQAEEIFYAVLSSARGAFAFVHGLDGATMPARLNLPAARLLFESVQRLDEETSFRERIPDASVVPSLASSATPSLTPTAKALLDRIDGARTLAELAREVGLGEFEATRALHHLLTAGVVQLAPPCSPQDALLDLMVGVNAILRDVHLTAAQAGIGAQARSTILAFIEDAGVIDALFAGAGPGPDGVLDAARIAVNLGALTTDDPLGFARQALHDFVSFALFAAGTVLPRESHKALSRRTQDALSSLHDGGSR